MAEPVLVLLPTRDRPAMLAEAVASVLAQTDPDWRLVVADDGDGGAESVVRTAARGDARVFVTRSAARSPGGARNAAFAHGERAALGREATLVAFLDDDDLWLPRHLELARRALERAPEAVLVHGDAIDREGGVDRPYHDPRDGPFEGHVWSRMLSGLNLLPSTMLVRAEPFRAAGGFRADLPNLQDLDLWLKIARDAPVAYVAEPSVVRRLHAGNVSRNAVDRVRSKARVLEHWWERRATLTGSERRLVRRLLADRWRRLVHRLRVDTDLPRAAIRREAWRCWCEVPSLTTFRGAMEAAFGPRRRR